jgi:hypothetical protein
MKLQEKIRIFGHYLFCSVKSGDNIITLYNINIETGCVHSGKISLPIEECVLVLKDLRSVSKKDAFVCAELANLPASLVKGWEIQMTTYGKVVFSWPGDEDSCKRCVIFDEDKLNWKQVDYLRSQGYAIGLPKEIYTTE